MLNLNGDLYLYPFSSALNQTRNLKYDWLLLIVFLSSWNKPWPGPSFLKRPWSAYCVVGFVWSFTLMLVRRRGEKTAGMSFLSVFVCCVKGVVLPQVTKVIPRCLCSAKGQEFLVAVWFPGPIFIIYIYCQTSVFNDFVKIWSQFLYIRLIFVQLKMVCTKLARLPAWLVHTKHPMRSWLSLPLFLVEWASPRMFIQNIL